VGGKDREEIEGRPTEEEEPHEDAISEFCGERVEEEVGPDSLSPDTDQM
jgi:hypothetical protein